MFWSSREAIVSDSLNDSSLSTMKSCYNHDWLACDFASKVDVKERHSRHLIAHLEMEISG